MKHLVISLAVLGATLPAQNAGITFNNNVDGYVEVPYSSHVVPQSGITVEAWVTYDDATLGPGYRYPTVVRQNRNAGQESFFLRINADNVNRKIVRWLVNSGTPLTVDWTFTPGQLNTWTHLAGTWDGRTARLFVNGQEVNSRTGVGGPLTDRGDVLRIGKGSDIATPIEVWHGSIDEVRLWPFARTGAEITATMNYSMVSVPGQVSTWNFDNNTQDSSSGRHGTIGGSVNFTTAVPPLALGFFPGLNLGASTPGCLGPIEAAPSSLPQVGNLAFALVGHRLPAGSQTVALLGFAPSPAPFPFLGINVWLDLSLVIDAFPTVVDPLGTARLPLPIDANAPAGLALAGQFVTLDPCGPAGLTASNAILFGILP